MKKRIVCVLLTLIMLLSLVPMGASAATHSTSAAAITVLKQMTKFESKCYHFAGSEFRIGYGTVCEGKHAFDVDGKPYHKAPEVIDGKEVTYYDHTITEAKADAALRKALAALDKKVCSFATANGLSLTQAQHDALVVFSYNAGSDWMIGNGVVKTAIVNKAGTNELLNAMNLWTKNANVGRRKVEVNMYMNGIYSNTIPSNYGQVTYDANGGYIAQGSPYVMHYDTNNSIPHITAPTHASKGFLGWYTEAGLNEGTWVPVLTKSQNYKTLYAHYMNYGSTNTNSYKLDASFISPKAVYKNDLTTGNAAQMKLIVGKTSVDVVGEKLDAEGNHWCKLADNAWVKVSGKNTGYIENASIKWTVTVTNSYVNRRVNATASSAKNGSYKMGDVLNILAEEDGWLQVGEIQDDGSVEAVGWVSGVYTDWGSAQSDAAESNSVVATAIVTFNGYLNIRQEPGTDSKIVGALAKKDTVDVYEIRTVNGHRWGRINSGWICLTYTSLTTLEKAPISDEGVKLYAFTAKVKTNLTPKVAAGVNNNDATYNDYKNVKNTLTINSGDIAEKYVTLTNLLVVNNAGVNETWAKVTWKNAETAWLVKNKTTQTVYNTRSGWIKLDSANVDLDPVKYTVAVDSINAREDAGNGSKLKFSLNKGTEVEVNDIKLVGEEIWGYVTVLKVVASNETKYLNGWINLASKYVSRNDIPQVEEEKHDTGKIATVINTDSLKVRVTGASYGKQIGSLARGTTVAVWESNEDGWYKVDSNQNGTYDYEGDGWVSGSYLDIREGSVGGNSTVTDSNGKKYQTDGTGKGIVANTYSGVNVRQGAGVNYASLGKLLPGTVVEILETSANGKWGRTAQGWVSLDYITMVSYNEVVNTPAGGTTVGSYGDAQKTTTTAVYTGYLNGSVDVYRTPEENKEEKIRTAVGENITIYELAAVTKEVVSDEIVVGDKTTTTTTTTTTYWARINDGWVKNPELTITLNALDEKVHTQTAATSLKVRTSPEIGTVIDALAQGDQVKVTALQIVKDKVWGRIETAEGTGWIRLDYMSEGAIYVKPSVQQPVTPSKPVLGNGSSTGGFVNNTSGYRYTGKVIRANEVNVRATPSTAAAKTTSLKNGQALVIYETTVAENMAWGRCDAGWIYLYYVDLTPVVGGAVDSRVVYNENTIIYSDVNCSAVAGTYSRMSVVDIFEIVGKMARTELGWVNVDNLL